MQYTVTWGISMPGYCATGLSKNELNNLIYMMLRYGFKFDGHYHPEPENQEIAAIMIAVGSPASKQKLIDETVKFVVEHYNLDYLTTHHRTNLAEVKIGLDRIYNEFLMLPRSLRNDLGEDVDANEFLDKN